LGALSREFKQRTKAMPNYIRSYVPDGSYFFTVALLERYRHLLTENIDTLRSAFRSVKKQRPLKIEAIVIPPYHLHCSWRLPPDDTDFSTRWRLIKTSFSRSIVPGERLLIRKQMKIERWIYPGEQVTTAFLRACYP
jgi:REP-associated tyrosine transposase